MKRIKPILPSGCEILKTHQVGDITRYMVRQSDQYAIFTVNGNTVLSPYFALTGEKSERIAPLRKGVLDTILQWTDDWHLVNRQWATVGGEVPSADIIYMFGAGDAKCA
jgi:hypothetical protein